MTDVTPPAKGIFPRRVSRKGTGLRATFFVCFLILEVTFEVWSQCPSEDAFTEYVMPRRLLNTTRPVLSVSLESTSLPSGNSTDTIAYWDAEGRMSAADFEETDSLWSKACLLQRKRVYVLSKATSA